MNGHYTVDEYVTFIMRHMFGNPSLSALRQAELSKAPRSLNGNQKGEGSRPAVLCLFFCIRIHLCVLFKRKKTLLTKIVVRAEKVAHPQV